MWIIQGLGSASEKQRYARTQNDPRIALIKNALVCKFPT